MGSLFPGAEGVDGSDGECGQDHAGPCTPGPEHQHPLSACYSSDFWGPSSELLIQGMNGVEPETQHF